MKYLYFFHSTFGDSILYRIKQKEYNKLKNKTTIFDSLVNGKFFNGTDNIWQSAVFTDETGLFEITEKTAKKLFPKGFK